MGGDRLQSVSKVVEDTSSELKLLAGMANSSIEEFGVAMAEAGRVVQRTALTELESAVGTVGELLETQVEEWKTRFQSVESALASIEPLLESTVLAAHARTEAAEAMGPDC